MALGVLPVAALLVTGLLAYDIGRRAFSSADRGAPAGSSPTLVAPANALELSVLDQPRAVPEIHFSDGQGGEVSLADFRGRVVLLNVWATWCVPCRKEMPALDRLEAKLG
ncbi:MAG: redoxin domain-containing protein, partial [Thiohalocapsa sp.]